MEKSHLKAVIEALGLTQVAFARAIGIDGALLRKMLMDDRHSQSRPVSEYVTCEARSLIARHEGLLPEWTIGIDAENMMEVTTIHHNIFPRFTAFIIGDLPPGVSMEAGNGDSISIIWHSHTGRMSIDDIRDWMNKALSAEENYNITLDDDLKF